MSEPGGPEGRERRDHAAISRVEAVARYVGALTQGGGLRLESSLPTPGWMTRTRSPTSRRGGSLG